MSTVAQMLAAAPSLTRAQKPQPGVKARWNDRTSATMAWWVKQSEAAAALNVIGGDIQVLSCYGASVSRLIPLVHPTYNWLLADEVDATDYGWEKQSDGTAKETMTLIKVTFRSPNYSLTGPTPCIEFSGNASPRQIPMPPPAFYTSHRPYFLHYGQVVNGVDFQLVLTQIPVFTLPLWVANMNTVNSTAWGGCAPGSVLYTGPQWSISQQLGGVTSYRVAVGFKVSHPNFLWGYGYIEDGSWGQLLNSSGNPIYGQVDFNTVLWPQ